MAIDVSPDLLAFLHQEETRARNEDLLERAENALKSYNGDYYGDEVDGQSKVVSRDVAEVVDQMNVAVLRTFVSGDRVVEFEPDSFEMEQVADDATEDFHRDLARRGYSLLHDWLKEGNISTLGVVKACVEKKKTRQEILSLDPEGDGAIESEPLDEEGMLHRAVVLQEQPATFRDYLVPLEEFRIAGDARDPDEAVYVAHASMKSISELTEMGFEADDLDDIQGDRTPESLAMARDGVDQQLIYRTGSNRRVLLLEEYVRFDADGDGISERLCVHRVGNTVLRIEPVDYQPFVIYCPFPMPGRIAGHSLADKVTDIQRVNTALMRLYLDGQYLTLAPRMYVPQECVTESTYDDLLTVIAGGLVRGKGEGPRALTIPHDGQSALQAMEFMIGQRESRTGITRHNQGLDADSLNKTATGMALLSAQGEQMQEYLARNFAESLARLMRLKLKLKSRYGSPVTLRVDGQYKQVDPRQWPEDMEVMIRVGLGSGRKDQRVQNRMTYMQVQREAMMGGLRIVTEEQIYKMMAGLAKDMDLGSPNDYVIDPSTLPPPDPSQQPPDPETQKVQGMLQLNAQKLQMQAQKDAATLQMKQQGDILKAQNQRADIEGKMALQDQNQLMQAHIAQQGQVMDQNIAMRKIDLAAHDSHQENLRKSAESDAKVQKFRSGGNLDQ